MSNNIIWNLFFYTFRTSCFSSFGVIFALRSYRLFPLDSRDSEAFLVRKLLFWCTASLTRSMSRVPCWSLARTSPTSPAVARVRSPRTPSLLYPVPTACRGFNEAILATSCCQARAHLGVRGGQPLQLVLEERRQGQATLPCHLHPPPGFMLENFYSQPEV